MKKKKPRINAHPDFTNNPFRSLKGLTPSTPSPVKKGIPSQVRNKEDNNDIDDTSLFLRATEGAKRFGQTNASPAAKAGQVPNKTDVQAPEDSRLFLAAMKNIGASFPEIQHEQEPDEAAHRSPTSRMRQLKRGDIRIRQELDLHGFLKEEALLQLERFIAAARSRRHEAVLVITGKGLNSPEGPVLKGAVAAWLRKNGKGLVTEFSSAPRELGGSGAFVVFLKKK
jgi:DNA-nicking Smr family endonuclease